MGGCSDCGKAQPAEWVADTVAAVAAVVGGAVATTGRLLVRGVCHWFDDGQIEHGRRTLQWRLSIEAAAAAALTWWLGRPAAFVFAGIFAASWILVHLLRVELQRRAVRASVTRNRATPGRRVDREPRTEEPGPDLDAAAEAMIAAYRATEDGS